MWPVSFPGIIDYFLSSFSIVFHFFLGEKVSNHSVAFIGDLVVVEMWKRHIYLWCDWPVWLVVRFIYI